MSDQTNNADPRDRAFLVCPRCGGQLRESQGMCRLINRSLVCNRCGYSMLPEEFTRYAMRQLGARRRGSGGRHVVGHPVPQRQSRAGAPAVRWR